MITQTCESCGHEFGCGAHDRTCWCSEVALGQERLAIVREHFERCLCPDCLAVAARGTNAHTHDGAPAYRNPVEGDYNRPFWRSGR